MEKALDEFDATRGIVEILQQFQAKDRDLIIRWACEKLGVAPQMTSTSMEEDEPVGQEEQHREIIRAGAGLDIKSFVLQKGPKSDTQFAAVVAYYYQFEVPEEQRREGITGVELQDACRVANRKRLPRPAQTLQNAYQTGYFNKSEHGRYKLNTVGENLVAMVLAGGSVTEQIVGAPRTEARRPQKPVVGKKK